MARTTPRAGLVQAVKVAWSIVDEAIPMDDDDPEEYRQEVAPLRAAALSVILRELLDYEVE